MTFHETRGLDLQAGWVPRATVVGDTTGSEIWVALASGLRTLQQLPPQVVTSASTPPRLPPIWLRPPSDRLNSESSAIVVRDPSLSLLFDSRLSNYVPDVETRCHYHCLVGPGKCFLDHQQSVAHHASLPSRTGWVRISRSSLWSCRSISHWWNFYIYIFYAVTLVYINFHLRKISVWLSHTVSSSKFSKKHCFHCVIFFGSVLKINTNQWWPNEGSENRK